MRGEFGDGAVLVGYFAWGEEDEGGLGGLVVMVVVMGFVDGD